MSKKINRMKVSTKHLITELRVNIDSVVVDIKPSYLWEISFGDCDHVFDFCKKRNIDLKGLQVIQINDILFITRIEILLRHLSGVVDPSFDSFIDVSPDLQTPQLLNQKQIETKKLILTELMNELKLNSMKSKIKVQSIGESMSDMCFICGALLGYPVIYCNRVPENGNCLSFIHLSNFRVENDLNQNIYCFSCPQKFEHLFDSKINSWFESILNKSKSHSLKLIKEIKEMSFLLT